MRVANSLTLILTFVVTIHAAAWQQDATQASTSVDQQSASSTLKQVIHSTGWDSDTASSPIRATGVLVRPLSTGDQSYALNVIYRNPQTFKTQLNDAATATVAVRSGESAASARTGSSSKTEYEIAESLRSYGVPPLRTVALALASGWSTRLVGSKLCGAEPCVGFGLEPPSGTDNQIARWRSLQVWVSSSTSLPLQIDFQVVSTTTPSDTATHSLILADFRNISGVLVPFTQEELRGERVYYRVQIQQFQFNSPVADSDFTLPRVEAQ